MSNTVLLARAPVRNSAATTEAKRALMPLAQGRDGSEEGRRGSIQSVVRRAVLAASDLRGSRSNEGYVELSSPITTLMPLSGWYVQVARSDDHEAS